jgi:hypothetical protein
MFVARAKSGAHDVAKRHPEREPDGFRLTDPTGKILGVFAISPSDLKARTSPPT